MTTDVAEIAAGLTKAQREAIAHPSHGPFSTSIYSLTRTSTRVALQRKGLVIGVMFSTALTPLGLAVRAHLKDKEA